MPVEPKPTIAEQIVVLKRSLNPRREAIRRAFSEVKDYVRSGDDAIRDNTAAGRAVIPEIAFRDIQQGSVSEAARHAALETGRAVVRGVFEESIAGTDRRRRRQACREACHCRRASDRRR